MAATTPIQNKALVLDAFDALFNKRNYALAERFWSETYIQHSAHIPPGRDGLFDLVRNLPDTLRLAEHWDVLQEEATQAESLSGRPMFGVNFAA